MITADQLNEVKLFLEQVAGLPVAHICEGDEVSDAAIFLLSDIDIQFYQDGRVGINKWLGDGFRTIVTLKSRQDLLLAITTDQIKGLINV